MELPIKVGVSSCLLGERVRYDGNHKHDPYIAGFLGRFFQFVPVCPEKGCGLPTPREAMRLEGDPANPRLVTVNGKKDFSGQMLKWCEQMMLQLEREDLSGFIFRRNSPSSGLFRVKVYNGNSYSLRGRGIFAAAVTTRFPLLPVEEDGRLSDGLIGDNFIGRVYAYHRLKHLLREYRGLHDLISFHRDHKLLLMSHAPLLFRKLGKMVAVGKRLAREDLLQRYSEMFMEILSAQATVEKNADVLLHMSGYFKEELTSDEKRELADAIGRYQEGLVSLTVPITLFHNYINKYGKAYLRRQYFLKTFPYGSMLRDQVQSNFETR